MPPELHEDFGEKIGGAKKDLWKDRGLYTDDLDGMNEREAEKYVKKDNVWKKPDYQAMLDEGIPLGVVFFMKKARDSLNASPQYPYRDNTPEKRLCGMAAVRLAVYIKGKDAKKYRKNVEYGSARWGTKADIAPFMDPKPENNIILTQSEGLMMSGRPKNPANARNKNVLVVGGSGSGKTRFFIKPNLMQMHSSYVVTDPKGTVLVECGKLLQRGAPKLDKDGKPVRDKRGKIVYEPYKIRVFNTINFSKKSLILCNRMRKNKNLCMRYKAKLPER